MHKKVQFSTNKSIIELLCKIYTNNIFKVCVIIKIILLVTWFHEKTFKTRGTQYNFGQNNWNDKIINLRTSVTLSRHILSFSTSTAHFSIIPYLYIYLLKPGLKSPIIIFKPSTLKLSKITERIMKIPRLRSLHYCLLVICSEYYTLKILVENYICFI